MTENSIILNRLASIYSFILKFYDRSYIKYILMMVIGKISASSKNSYIVLSYADFKERRAEDASDSSFFKLLERLNIGLRRSLSKHIESSVIVSGLIEKKLDYYILAIIVVASPLIPTMVIIPLSFTVILLAKCKMIVGRSHSVYSKLYTVFYGLFLLSIVIGLLFNIDTLKALESFVIYMSAIYLGFILPGVIDTREKIYSLIRGMAFVLGILSLYGFYQKVAGAPVDPNWMDERFGDDIIRIYSVFGNPNVYGEYLILTIPIAITSFFIEKKKTMKVLFGCIVLASVINLFLTLSRASMAGFLVGIVVIVVLKLKKMIPILLIGMLISPIFLPDYIVDRAMSTFNMGSQSQVNSMEVHSGADTSILYRGAIYRSSLEMMKDHPISGVGIGQFSEVYKLYGVANSYHPHNTFLMVAIETGILGITSLILLGVTWAKNMVLSVKYKGDALSFLNVAILGAIVGCSIQGLADHIWHNYNILLIFFTLIGIGYSSFNVLKEEDHEH